MAERAAIHAYLSQGSYEGLRQFSTREGVTMSSVLEAFGSRLSSNGSKVITLSDLVKDARQIDAERRFRGKRD